MTQETKRVWSTPELIVLVRSGPEEAVLGACKSAQESGPYASEGSCTAAIGVSCDPCPQMSSS